VTMAATMTAAPPTLATARLVLRPPVAADFPALAAMLASDRARWMGGPYDLRGAWGLFSHGIACWTLYGYGTLMIDLPDGTTVGQAELNGGPWYPEPELGWLLFPGHEGNGYATEAAAALRDWAFAHTALVSLVSYVHPDNHASADVARRLGGVEDPRALRQDGDETDLVFRHRRRAA
jgi:RimJ/RimL family protein N-acetyltransferase